MSDDRWMEEREAAGRSGGDRSDTWDPDRGDVRQGVYRERREPKGKMTSCRHEFEELDGTPWGVWGTAGLDRALADVPIGSLVTLTYDGKHSTEDGKRTYHKWGVRYRLPRPGAQSPDEKIPF